MAIQPNKCHKKCNNINKSYSGFSSEDITLRDISWYSLWNAKSGMFPVTLKIFCQSLWPVDTSRWSIIFALPLLELNGNVTLHWTNMNWEHCTILTILQTRSLLLPVFRVKDVVNLLLFFPNLKRLNTDGCINYSISPPFQELYREAVANIEPSRIFSQPLRVSKYLGVLVFTIVP